MRARNLKPSLFTNDILAFASPIHTVTFAGLWCIADRRGVLEDSPTRVHMLVNPGRTLRVTQNSLDWLENQGFIKRYKYGKLKLIKVLAFTKHQNPHKDEKPSSFPDLDGNTGLAQGQHGADTVPAEKKPEPIGLIPSSLIPDSLNLIPDSGSPLTAAPAKEGVKTPFPENGSGALKSAELAWISLVSSGGKRRDPVVERALAEIGGWPRISGRKPGDEPTIRKEFIAAYRNAAS